MSLLKMRRWDRDRRANEMAWRGAHYRPKDTRDLRSRLAPTDGPYLVRHTLRSDAEWRLEDLVTAETGVRLWIPRHGGKAAATDAQRVDYEIVGPISAKIAEEVGLAVTDQIPELDIHEPRFPPAALSTEAVQARGREEGYYPVLPVSWDRWGVFYLAEVRYRTSRGQKRPTERIWTWVDPDRSLTTYSDERLIGARIGQRIKMPGER